MEIERLRFNLNPKNAIPRTIGHPQAHKLKFTQNGRYSKQQMPRSYTNLATLPPFARETSFEIERPQSQGASKLVINVATSFVDKHRKFRTDKNMRRSIPVLPTITTPRTNLNSSPRSTYRKFMKHNPEVTLDQGAFRARGYERPASPVLLSNEKKTWIYNWIKDTNTEEELLEASRPPTSDALPIINEQENYP